MAVVGQVEKISSLSASQSCEGLEVVNDLPDRGRGVKVHNQVVCDYRSQQMTNNDGKHKYNNSPEQVVGCMFASYTAVYCSSATSNVVGFLTSLSPQNGRTQTPL